ncbi:MAG: hypothetical protein ABIQ88_20165 [Chitinophagaceae bacterium]
MKRTVDSNYYRTRVNPNRENICFKYGVLLSKGIKNLPEQPGMFAIIQNPD